MALFPDSGATYTIPFDFADRFKQFDADFQPAGSVGSASSALRTDISARYTAPKALPLKEPASSEDYVDASNTAAHWRPAKDKNGSIFYRDITGNGNDMTLRGADTDGTVTLTSDTDAFSSAPEAVHFATAPGGSGRYFETVAGAPINSNKFTDGYTVCLLYTSPSPRD